ncbi:MAG: carboxylating nicotinate-nucleotide diphosphorylase [Desulfovibrio sp.]|nr:carboxylating nicotinate-nucleotide diphosphorylase [Desulfovibrio sp.]
MKTWDDFFSEKGRRFLLDNITLALAEDGQEKTAEGIFTRDSTMRAIIRAKEDTLVVGLPLIDLVMERLRTPYSLTTTVSEGEEVKSGTTVARIEGGAISLLKAERVILNYICHLSGIANLTKRYADILSGTGVRLLDTRKTTPGLRWPEKYAIQRGGGTNHRMDLEEMLMLKDNHIDAVGSITTACEALRARYSPCPPIEVECRTLSHVREAVQAKVERIMLDNMDIPLLSEALPLIPASIEAEVSGGVTLDTLLPIANASPRRPDFISVGRLTHSATSADFSMTLENSTEKKE